MIWVAKSFTIIYRRETIKSVNSLTFVSRKAKISRDFDSRKDAHQVKLESRPQISVKVRLREMCDWKLSGLCTVDNMTISFCEKRGINQKRRDWVNETLILELIFCDPQWQTICCKKWHPDTLGISKPPEIAVETQFHVQHSIKTTLVFLPTDNPLGCCF